MGRKKLTITIDNKILKKYKKFCEKHAINISRRIEKHIEKEMKGK